MRCKFHCLTVLEEGLGSEREYQRPKFRRSQADTPTSGDRTQGII
ncbi:hypothetical protein [Nostoc sp. NMS7]|nr:hypothetical protein [Nostoc sp. NMS7]